MVGDCRDLLNVLFQIWHSGTEENEKKAAGDPARICHLPKTRQES